MKLLFIYFYEKMGTFKENTCIQFNKKYNIDNIEIMNQKSDFNFYLSVNQLYQDDFYSSNSDIGVLIGENGTGKSILINSIRNEKNDYSIIVFEDDNKFFFLNYVHKTVHLKIENRIEKVNKIDDNFKYIYYSSILDASDNDIDSNYNISNRRFLSKYDDLSLNNRLSLIENDDIHRYFNLSKSSKLDYIKLEKLKLYPSKTYFEEVKEKLINNHELELFESFIKLMNKTKDEIFIEEFLKSNNLKTSNEIFALYYKLIENQNFITVFQNDNNLIRKIYINITKTIKKEILRNRGYLLIDEITSKIEINKIQSIVKIYNLKRYEIPIMMSNNSFIDFFNDINLEDLILKIIDNFKYKRKLNSKFGEFLENKEYRELYVWLIFNNLKSNILDGIKNDLKKEVELGLMLSIIKIVSIKAKGLLYYLDNRDIINELIIKAIERDILITDELIGNVKNKLNKKYFLTNYLDKYIKEMIDISKDIKSIKLLFVLMFQEYSKKLKDEDKIVLRLYLNTIINLIDDTNKYKNYEIDATLFTNELLDNFDKYFRIFENSKEFNVLKESIKFQNGNLFTTITDDFFDTYEKIIKNSIKPFTYEIEPPLSSGQKAILFIFARINDAIQKMKEHKENQNILILLDEADLKLHLEWQRKFVYDLMEFLSSYPNNKFYILYATHSPMILSDITDDRVVFLQKNGEFSNDVSMNIIPKKRTFGANIYDLYHDSFFMEQFMGQFAQNKINQIIDIINLYKIIEEYEKIKKQHNDSCSIKKVKSFVNKYDLLKISNSFRQRYLIENIIEQKNWKQYILSEIKKMNKEKEYLQKVKNKILEDKINLYNTIESIGEPLLRNQLLDEVKTIGISDNMNEIIDKLKNLSHDEIEQELNKYDREKQIELWKNLFKIKEKNND